VRQSTIAYSFRNSSGSLAIFAAIPLRQVAAYRYGIAVPGPPLYYFRRLSKEGSMAWTTPVLVEICIGLEINGYMPADGYVPPEF